MVEKILPNIYRLEIPLPNNPLQSLNSYVIKDSKKSLIIDTGMNREACKSAMFSGLAEIGINLGEIEFFITHMHADHCGLVTCLTAQAPTIYCSPLAATDIAGLSTAAYWEKIRKIGLLGGFSEEELELAINSHLGYKYSPSGRMNFKTVKDKDTISIGGYHFICLETPGHTTGHVCLYEPNQKILFSGGHLLTDITSNISLGTSYNNNLLSDFISNLDKINELDLVLVLPGHRSLISDHKDRIQELKTHHAIMANEVLSILKDGRLDAYHTA